MYKDIKYFKGLNALRFFAAYLVVMHHAEQIRLKNGLFNLKHLSLFNNGGLAVTFFFVLSGFLITYLLLKELNSTRDVSIKKFYTRRILRIWPLYYLLVVIGTMIIPFLLGFISYNYEMPYRFKDVYLYYIFFTPFMVNVIYGHHFLEPLWSIGVEELFYIFWAPLHKFFKNHILKLILSVITVKLLLLIILPFFNPTSNTVLIVEYLQFEAMAIGGLTAYIIYNRKHEIDNGILFSVPAQIILVTFIVLRICAYSYLSESSIVFKFLFTYPVFSSFIMIISFAWLIVNIALNKKSIFKLNHKFLEFLGDISYGVYMYHMLLIFCFFLFFKNTLAGMNNLLATVFFYVIISVGVIIVSHVSKKYFENYFLNLKSKFQPETKK
ncbi:MAG: O-acetyltransferase OatA [Bacteroidetes bacterium ADurb.Bin408]|nr:MAG: O-acetyltransferase OatA [Bacteroidetes bacterium ADurb.Bin408]